MWCVCGAPFDRAVLEVDFLMNAVHTPLSESQRLNYTSGVGGYPAFLFTAQSNVQLPVEESFSYPRLWSDFSMSAVVKPVPVRHRGGFLVAVVSPSGTHVQFGLRISDDGGTDSSKIQLYYADRGTVPESSAVIAEFAVTPPLTGDWNRLTVKVKGDHVTLLVDCSPHGTVTVDNRVRDITFQYGSTFYVGQAGPRFADDKFEVSTSHHIGETLYVTVVTFHHHF